MANATGYSDLEVARMSMIHSSEKMAMVAEERKRQDDNNVSPVETIGPPAYVAPPAPVLSRQNTDASSDHNVKLEAGAPTSPPEKTILGMRKRLFIIVASVSGILLVTILSIVLGVTLSKRAANQARTPPGVPTANSHITATNWTAPNGVSRTAVFFQDSEGTLMWMQKETLSNKWTLKNITASVMNTSSVAGLDVLPGSPLAVVTNRFQLSLYYMSSNNYVNELFCSDPVKGEWIVGALQADLHPKASQGSGLAAAWQLCQNCSNSLVVIYADDLGAIQGANLTNGRWEGMPAIATGTAPGSDLAISPFVDFRGTGPTGTDPNALRVYRVVGSSLMEQLMGPLTNGRWEIGNFGQSISTVNSANDRATQIASITYGNNGWINNLVTYLTAKGTLVSHTWTGTTWTTKNPTFTGGPAGAFTAISTTQNLRMYAVMSGGIHEYRVTPETDPFAWSYVGPVSA